MRVDIDLSEVDELIENLPEAERVIFNEIDLTMHRSLDIFQGEVRPRTPVVFGTLRNSISPHVQGISPNLHGELRTSLVYGDVVELGRRPGKWPPQDAIELWVRRKLGLSGPEAEEAAFLIARKIGRSGTQGAYMFRDGFRAGKGTVIRQWETLPGRVVPKIERKL